MKIKNLSVHDSIKCVVTGANDKGSFLKITDLENESLTGRIFNTALPKGTIVLASISKYLSISHI